MDCHSNHSVFLRANGSLACWCDAGSNLILKTYDPEINYSKDVVFGDTFRKIRNKLKNEEMPFPRFCQDCMVLANGACFNPHWEEKKEILTFQVEASIACILECPGCMTFAERKQRHGRPWHLEIGIFRKYLEDFRDDGVSIRTIDFQGHGEPLLNKDVWKLVALAKSHFPQAQITMCTASHGKYDRCQVLSGIDRMMFAIDGIDQQSFEPNRVRGNFDKAYTFMKSFCHGAKQEGRDIETIWKYILFDCNNRPEQLIRAQEMAAEAGVGEIHFVNTQLGLKSSRTFALEDIPKLDNGVKVTLSGYLSNFHDTLHGLDKARFALMEQDAEAAISHLRFAANMVRRRFECMDESDVIPEDYQVLIHEILNLSDHRLIDERTRTRIRGGFHSVLGNLDMNILAAKDQIIRWKSEEISRLTHMLNGQGAQRSRFARPVWLGRQIDAIASVFGPGSLPVKNDVIRRQSREIHKLATLLERNAAPDISVM